MARVSNDIVLIDLRLSKINKAVDEMKSQGKTEAQIEAQINELLNKLRV